MPVQFVIDPPLQEAIPLVGGAAAFPVRRIYCVGRNYAEHAREMGHDPDREPPFFFQKNPDNLRFDGKFPFPSQSSDVQFEIELAVLLGAGGKEIDPVAAPACIWGYAVALDMTRRDLQAEAKKLGRPWDMAKAFDHSAPCSPAVPVASCGLLKAGAIWLDVNGHRRQSGDLSQMIWDIPAQIAALSRFVTLAPGDVILTGTPGGVGRVAHGDRLAGGVAGVATLAVEVV